MSAWRVARVAGIAVGFATYVLGCATGDAEAVLVGIACSASWWLHAPPARPRAVVRR